MNPMKNLTMSVQGITPPEAINTMADDGVDWTFWIEYLKSDAVSMFGSPAGNEVLGAGNWNYYYGVDEGMWNHGVVGEGVWNYGLLEEMSMGAGNGMMVGAAAAGSSSQLLGSPPSGLTEQQADPVTVSDEEESKLWQEYSRFELPPLPSESSSFAVGMTSGAEVLGQEWMVGVGGALLPPGSMDNSVLIPTDDGVGGDGGYGGLFPSQALQPVVVDVEVEAPRENLNLGKKRAAAAVPSKKKRTAAAVPSKKKRAAAAPPKARASKKRRSPSGSIETSDGSNGEETGSELSDLTEAMAAALRNVYRKQPAAAWVWWRDTVRSPGYTDADFKRDFHISRSTFHMLCKMLGYAVAKDGRRATIFVPKRVAVFVFCLATGARFRDLAVRFDICASSCHKAVREVAAAITKIVKLRPDGAKDMAAASNKFQALTGGIPGVIGAVYTAHYRIIAPGHHVYKYYNHRLTQRSNRKTSYSVTLHAAVDADGAFTDICAGKPGGMSDEEIFSLSPLSQKRAVDQMVAQGKRLVGGAGYPLTDCTLVPYTHSDLTLPQREFNKKVELARGVAVDAFRRLKARWACLQTDRRGKRKPLRYLSSVMEACCVLHNLCERNGDELGDELKGFELEDDEMVLENPVRSYAAAQARDAIAHNLFYCSPMAAPTTTK